MLSSTIPSQHKPLLKCPQQQQAHLACSNNRHAAFKSSYKRSKALKSISAAAGAQHGDAELTRRQALQAGGAALLLPLLTWQDAASAQQLAQQDAAAVGSTEQLQQYINQQQQYRLNVPAGWEKKEKAGADVLFEDPERRSTSVGVTVSPVRVASIEQFGDVETVGKRLLDAERKKESTLDVQLLSSASRSGKAGATLYDFQYQLDSTRGVKRIFNTVTITGSKLYILNGNYKCDKDSGCAAAEAGPIALLREIAASFDAGSSL